MFKPKAAGLTINNVSNDYMMTEEDQKSYVPLFNTNKIRALVLGDTGAGKTTFMVNLIKTGSILFTKLHIIAPEPTLMQGMYRKLTEHFNGEPDENGNTKDIVRLWVINEYMPDVEDFEADEQHFVIIDDWITQDNEIIKKISSLVVRGSRRKMHIFMLSQKYKSAVPTTIRDNCNVFILFGTTSRKTIIDIGDDHFSSFSKSDYDNFIPKLKQKAHNFLIMLKNTPADKAFSINNEYYIPKDVRSDMTTERLREKLRVGIRPGLLNSSRNANSDKDNSSDREEGSNE